MKFKRRTEHLYGSAGGYEPLGLLMGTTRDGEVLINIKHHMKKSERNEQGYKRRPIEIESNKKMLAIYVENEEETIDLLIKVCEDLCSELKAQKLWSRSKRHGDCTKNRE